MDGGMCQEELWRTRVGGYFGEDVGNGGGSCLGIVPAEHDELWRELQPGR